MIVPMKEVTLVAARGDQAATLAVLQDFGVMHLVEAPAGTGDGLAVTRARLASARRAAEVLAASTPAPERRTRQGAAPPAPAAPASVADGGAGRGRSAEEVVAEVERLAVRLEDLHLTHAELVEHHRRLAPFGAFDPEAVRRLHDDGVGVRLARPSLRLPLPEVEDATWVELGRDRRSRTVALVGAREAVAAAEVPDEIDLPRESPERLAHEIAQVDAELRRTRERLAALSVARAEVERWMRHAEDAVRFEEARAAMETVGAVAVLRGFVPVDAIDRLRALAQQHGWGLWIADVLESDAAPTLIRNPRWVRPIEPLFSFLGVVPGYGQVDISVPFLVFFGIFFAMIVGDAGYGLLFLALTEVARRRLPASSQRVVTLLRVLSVGTIVWGVASGNYFGIAALPPVLEAVRLGWLTEERNMIALAFTIGVIHLTLAHGWNVVRFINSTRALVELGWIATTWTMYFLARQLVLGDPFPDLAWVSLAVGVILIAGFITPWRRLRTEWFTHAMLPLNLVSNFVDVVSYVRLFAVGAATFAVAESFNALAASIGLGGVLGGLVSALVLFFGHTLNVLLAAMGVLVHGVRLNTLEFAGHLGMSWTGHPYRPFARIVPKDVEGEPSWTPR
jgi:V/A-type H+/Na+-transporting ATPase subunit I